MRVPPGRRQRAEGPLVSRPDTGPKSWIRDARHSAGAAPTLVTGRAPERLLQRRLCGTPEAAAGTISEGYADSVLWAGGGEDRFGGRGAGVEH